MQTYVVVVKSVQPQNLNEECFQEAVGLSKIKEAVWPMFACDVDVEVLAEKHCGFMGEGGFAVDVGLAEKVRLFECCSWEYPHTGPVDHQGDDLGSLVAFVMHRLRLEGRWPKKNLQHELNKNNTNEAGE